MGTTCEAKQSLELTFLRSLNLNLVVSDLNACHPRYSHTLASNSTGSWATSRSTFMDTQSSSVLVYREKSAWFGKSETFCKRKLFVLCTTGGILAAQGDTFSDFCNALDQGANKIRKCVGTKISPSSGSNRLERRRKKVFLSEQAIKGEIISGVHSSSNFATSMVVNSVMMWR